MSIFLEAIQRFVEPQEVSNPKLILIVGCFGLLSNILGLLLFHEHGHSHGGGGHSHSHSHAPAGGVSRAEEGKHAGAKTDEVPESTGLLDDSASMGEGTPQTTRSAEFGQKPGHKVSKSASSNIAASDSSASPLAIRKTNSSQRRGSQHKSRSRSRRQTADDIPIHPASIRNNVIQTGRLDDIESQAGSDESDRGSEYSDGVDRDDTPLLRGGTGSNYSTGNDSTKRSSSQPRHQSSHADHLDDDDAESQAEGHSHSDLNMKGVFLHVMGDALGNLGVIASALIIWLTKLPGRFYADPAISLIITFIILGSAIPLCKAASRILLQAVPAGVNVDKVKNDILTLPGVLSCHHLHVWQLSDTKKIASLHIEVEYDFKGEGSARYMELARGIQKKLRRHGIHESTIQPEFCLDASHVKGTEASGNDCAGSKKPSASGSKLTSRASSLRNSPEACLLDCGDDCDDDGQCCNAKQADAETPGVSHRH